MFTLGDSLQSKVGVFVIGLGLKSSDDVEIVSVIGKKGNRLRAKSKGCLFFCSNWRNSQTRTAAEVYAKPFAAKYQGTSAGIDIADPSNGVCMDKDSHDQTKTYDHRDRNSYLSQIRRIFDETKNANNEIDCDEVRRRLRIIKDHLHAQNQASQLRTKNPQLNLDGPNVNLGSITF